MIGKSKKQIDNRILELSEEILGKLSEHSPNFDQVGIDNGLDIIKDYLDNNERGLAFEHLQYIVEEMSIKLEGGQKETYESIKSYLYP